MQHYFSLKAEHGYKETFSHINLGCLAEDMTQQLLTGLSENLSSVPITHVGQLTVIYNSSFRISDPLASVHIHTHAHTHTQDT